MRALVLDGEWSPRPGYRLTADEVDGGWAREARQVWRHPRWALTDVVDPRPQGPHDVVIRVRAAGIAVSTLRMTDADDEGYVRLPYRMALPVVPGHEFAGEVVEIGGAVTGLSPGDPVAVESLRPCGRCAACIAGRPNSCQVGGFAGFTQNGGLAEYAVVPAARLRALTGVRSSRRDVDVYELGVACEPAAIAYVGIFLVDGHLRPGMNVAVFGAGPIGQAAVALARCAGAATVCAFDPHPLRRDLARAFGADIAAGEVGDDAAQLIADATRGAGADLVVDATGDAASVLPTIQAALAIGGHVLQLGVGGPDAAISAMSTMVRGAVHSFSMGHLGGFDPVIDLQARGRLDLGPMIGRRSGLDAALAALDDSDVRQGPKRLVVMPGGALE